MRLREDDTEESTRNCLLLQVQPMEWTFTLSMGIISCSRCTLSLLIQMPIYFCILLKLWPQRLKPCRQLQWWKVTISKLPSISECCHVHSGRWKSTWVTHKSDNIVGYGEISHRVDITVKNQRVLKINLKKELSAVDTHINNPVP